MALDFTVRDVMHKIITKFYPAYLPGSKKPYNLRAVMQPELNIHELASKAEVYNIQTSPKVIEEGFTAGLELLLYLIADGYKVKTPLFTVKVSFPGEYIGSETHLPDGIYPQGRIVLSAEMRKYLRERIEVQFDGIEDTNGIIAEAVNLITGEVDITITPDGLFELRGYGLKIDADADHTEEVGIFLQSEDGTSIVRINPLQIAVNEPKTIRAIAPNGYTIFAGTKYYVIVRTQTSAKNNAHLLKHIREMRSDFLLTAQ